MKIFRPPTTNGAKSEKQSVAVFRFEKWLTDYRLQTLKVVLVSVKVPALVFLKGIVAFELLEKKKKEGINTN